MSKRMTPHLTAQRKRLVFSNARAQMSQHRGRSTGLTKSQKKEQQFRQEQGYSSSSWFLVCGVPSCRWQDAVDERKHLSQWAYLAI